MTAEQELPPDHDPRHIRRTGARVIEHGLPGLPEVLTYQMSIPVAYWRVPSCAVVLFLRFQQWDGKFWPKVTMGSSGGASTQKPEPGYPAAVAVGRVAHTVKQIALIQDGHQDRHPLESHFGAWAVCTDKPGAYDVAALDEHGIVLATLRHPIPPPRPPGPTPGGTRH
jgi:hypothetical protein